MYIYIYYGTAITLDVARATPGLIQGKWHKMDDHDLVLIHTWY